MKPSNLLKAGRARYKAGTPLIDAMRINVEYPVYCWALFLLKRAVGCNPAEPLFQHHVRPSYTLVIDWKAAFTRAIAMAEAQEAGG